MENTKQPEVGMGATISYWSDRAACTVIRVSGKSVWVQLDEATRIDKNGMSDCQEYDYSPNANGTILRFSLRKNGRWAQSGSKYTLLSLGNRRSYHDYSF